MNSHPTPPDDSWESDSVWPLLDRAAPSKGGPRFVDDTVRLAKLEPQERPWWKRLFSPAPLAGLATAAAALALSFAVFPAPSSPSVGTVATADPAQAAHIQEIVETETLLAAVDHLEDFSDNELVSLIGF